MNTTKLIFGAFAIATLGSSLALAQQGDKKGPPPPMSFLLNRAAKGDGANYGGIAGADQYCQNLAAAAGAGNRTWHAYMSSQGPNAVNARDRIGNGPWFNAKGQRVAQNLS